MLRISSSCRHQVDLEETIVLLIWAKIFCKVDYQLPFNKIKNRAIIFSLKKDLYIQDKKMLENNKKYPFKFVLLCGCAVHELFGGYGD